MSPTSWLSDTRAPQATLTTSPAVRALAPRRLACTVFSMKQKSRVVSPSPKMVGDSPWRIFVTKRGMTAAYSDCGSCRGPKTLKYRSESVSKPKSRPKTAMYCSPVCFDTA